MRFRKGAKLDPSQVEDYRGQGGGLGGLGGGKVLGGGGGLIGVVVLVLYLVIASQGGGGLGDLGSLAGQTAGPGTPNHRARAGVPHRRGRERARGLPHRRRRQQRPGVLGEGAAQLRAGDDAVLRRADLDPLWCARRPPSARSTAPPTGTSISTSASSTP